MKIVDRYVLSGFLKSFIGSLLGVSGAFTVLSILDSLTYQLGKEGVTVLDIVRFYLLQLPQTVFMTTPISTLLSAMITLGAMNQRQELMAFRAAGVSIARATVPILAAAAAVSGLLFILGNTLVPIGMRAFNEAQQEAGLQRIAPNQRIWYVSEKPGSTPTLLRIEKLKRRTGDLIGVTALPMDQTMVPREELVAKRATYLPGRGWKLLDVDRRIFSGLELPQLEHLDEFDIDLAETPEELLKAQRPSEEMTWAELGEQIQKVQRFGRSPNPYKVERHARLAIPLAAVILVLVGVPLAIRPARSGGLAVGILGAIVIGFAYYVIIALFITMGKGDLLPPWAAAWTANIIFGSIGVAFFSSVRK